jgi:hypothetical protein
VVAALVVLVKDDGEPGGAPAAEASPAPVVRAVPGGDVEVRLGRVAAFTFSVEGAQSAPLTAVLEVVTSDGERVKRFRIDEGAQSGDELSYRWRVDVPTGSYEYGVLLEDPTGEAETETERAALVVTPRPGFPSADAIESALEWAESREGRVSVAVVDTNGHLVGMDEHRHYRSASLVKAMLLVQYLRRHRTLDAGMEDTLRRMIVESDNAAADVVFAEVRPAGLRRLAERLGMRDFVVSDQWVLTQVSAADQARFFFELDAHVPRRHRAFAREVLAGITPRQRWGIVAASGPLGWATFFKSGWLDPITS